MILWVSEEFETTMYVEGALQAIEIGWEERTIAEEVYWFCPSCIEEEIKNSQFKKPDHISI